MKAAHQCLSHIINYYHMIVIIVPTRDSVGDSGPGINRSHYTIFACVFNLSHSHHSSSLKNITDATKQAQRSP